MHAFQPKQKQPPQRTSSTTAKRDPAHSIPHQEHPILNLQRTIGNQAVLRLMRAGVEAGDAGFSGSHGRFTYNSASIPVFPPPVRGLQPKLTVNAPGDVYEQEADRVSEQVMRMPDPATAAAPAASGGVAGVQRACACGGTCDDCKKEHKDDEHAHVQTRAAGPASMGGIEAPPIVQDVLRSPGRPLDVAMRAFMEPRFGYDFSGVRVHADKRAGESAQAIKARAYTVGRDVVFGAGEFAPGSTGRRWLLAHELAHVRQQSRPGHAPMSVQRFDAGEHKAIGDAASGQRTIFLAPDMPVTYGEVVALAGDYFGDWQTLVRLAYTKGITEGTRGELWYAILVKVRPSFQGTKQNAEAEGMGKFFDEKAKAAVNARYEGLAIKNVPHFPNPKEGDAARSQAVKDAGPGAIGAGASYRQAHGTALMVAAATGQKHKSPAPRTPSLGGGAKSHSLDGALVIEAFADHFLTDAFSAGHQQTERASVQGYWDAKVPDFWDKLKHWLAQSVVLELRKKPASTLTKIGSKMTPQWVKREVALPEVEAIFAKHPQLSFGVLVSGAIHDYFNEHGAQADIAGRRTTLVGDSRLLTQGPLRHVSRESKDTFDAAKAAVQAGIEEIYQAYELGRQGMEPEIVPDKILKMGGGLLAAESLMPTLAPDASVGDPKQKSINWKVGTCAQLMADPKISEGLRLTVNRYATLFAASLSSLSEEKRKAVDAVLISKMNGDTRTVTSLLKEIINYTPIQAGGIDPDLLNDLQNIRQDVLRH